MSKWFLTVAVTVTSLSISALSFASSGASHDGGAGGIKDPKAGWEHLWHECLIDIILIGVIFAIITLYLLIANRRTSPDQVGTAGPLSSSAMLSWVFIPTFLFMADDFYLGVKAWDLFRVYRTMPEDGLEIKMDASMWNFHFTYPNGIELDNELVVPKGTPVVMRMTSYDTIHSLYPVNHWVKEDAMPGRITHMWFLPTEVGESVLTCAEYCGFGHSGMYGTLIVKEQADYDRWVMANTPETEMLESEGSEENL